MQFLSSFCCKGQPGSLDLSVLYLAVYSQLQNFLHTWSCLCYSSEVPVPGPPRFANICTDKCAVSSTGNAFCNSCFSVFKQVLDTLRVHVPKHWPLLEYSSAFCVCDGEAAFTVRRKITYAVAYQGCSSYGVLSSLPKQCFSLLLNFQNEYPREVCIFWLRKTFKHNESKRG